MMKIEIKKAKTSELIKGMTHMQLLIVDGKLAAELDDEHKLGVIDQEKNRKDIAKYARSMESLAEEIDRRIPVKVRVKKG